MATQVFNHQNLTEERRGSTPTSTTKILNVNVNRLGSTDTKNSRTEERRGTSSPKYNMAMAIKDTNIAMQQFGQHQQ